MEQYIEMFIEESEEHIISMSDDLMEFEEDVNNIDIVNTMFRSAHTIKGMAGSMGFASMQNLTHKIENIMDDIRNEKMVPSQDTIDFMFQGIDRLEILLGEIKETGSENTSVDDILSEEIDSENFNDRNEGYKLTDFERGVLKEFLEEDINIFDIHFKLNDDCLLKYVRSNMFFTELSELGDIFKMNKTEEHIEDEEAFDGTLNLIFITDKGKEEITTLKDKLSEVEKIEVVNYKEEESVKKKKEVKVTKKKKDASSPQKIQTQSIRVSLDKMDSSMSFFEELVVERGRLRSIANRISDRELNDSLDQIDKNSSDLQNGLLSMRMVPVDMIFNRFPRMVRNTSREMGKKVNFKMEGADTELDRTIVDELGDPLIHLLRNSLDHGVEMPDVRLERGKNEEGTILLKAYREGNEAVLEIKDDGNGIDTEKIKEKLVNNGVYSEEEARKLTVSELNQMIFSSGLSTAKEVTDISGRGVGLDVVRTKIESLGGNVRVESSLGEGTSFIIRIPLTLSILQALSVKEDGNQYLIPLSNISDVVFLKKEMISTLVTEDVLKYRNEILDIFKYTTLLGGRKGYENKRYALIIKGSKKNYSLLVDEIVGEMEIVLKPLSGYIKNTPGVTGATVLGDGSVALVYDTNYI